MFRATLEFAPDTVEDCKKLIGSMFSPTQLLNEYQAARRRLQTGDLVVVGAEWDGSGFEIHPRMDWVRGVGSQNHRAAQGVGVFTIAHQSAHKLAKLPWDSDAFWIVILRKEAIPVMCVVFAIELETEVVPGAVVAPN
jgi:hypothetical protein